MSAASEKRICMKNALKKVVDRFCREEESIISLVQREEAEVRTNVDDVGKAGIEDS